MSSPKLTPQLRKAMEALARELLRAELAEIQQLVNVQSPVSPKERIAELQRALKLKFDILTALLPPFPAEPVPLSAPLIELIPNWREAISIFVTGGHFTGANLLGELNAVVRNNAIAASLTKFSQSAVEEGSRVLPPEYEGAPAQTAEVYLRSTPYLSLLTANVPVEVPEDMRAQGTHIVAPPKRGKTTLMQALIAQDLTRVARGEASIIVIDAKDHPTESLIGPLRRFKHFARGGALHERVTVIDPHPEYPPALNPFDIGHEGDVPEEQRDSFRSHLLDFLEHAFGGMFEFGFSNTQSICFVKAVDVVLALPKAHRRFQALRDVLSDRGKQYLPYLNEEQRRFITVELKGQYDKRKEEINARLDFLLIRWRTLEKMFNARTCEFRIREQMDEGRVIILNTSRARLGEGCSMYGRLFINMIRAAAFQRKSSIPVYLFIDECHDYVATDKKLAEILDQCRSFNICPIFAHQRLGQFKVSDVHEAVAQCGIKFANTEENAGDLAPRFGLEDPTRLNLPRGQFALKLEGRRTLVVNVPLITLPSMTEKEQTALTAAMREKYCWRPDGPTVTPSAAPLVADAPRTQWGQE